MTARFGRDPFDRHPYQGLRFLDIGCGGGLLSEPVARLGAAVVGADPSEKNIKTASIHAAEQDLSIDYRVATAEDLAAAGEKFDVILNMEVIEHVADPALLCRDLYLDAQARRSDVRRHPEPHAEILWPRDHRS